MLNARDVTAKHQRRTVLHEVDFAAQPGQITAIVGPSGAGKSTLLKAMTGDQPYAGQIMMNGLDVARTRPARLAEIRAVLPQATPLAFPFTVAEVVRLGVMQNDGATHVVAQALAQVGLAGFEGAFFQELSGGEQQRVHLARVLAQVWHPLPDGTPRWLFLDEPVSSLDIGHQLQIMQVVQGFAARGCGVVMVMHDLNLTAMCAQSVSLMREGRIVAQGAPDAVFRNDLLSRTYGCALAVNTPPASCAYVLPQAAAVGPL